MELRAQHVRDGHYTLRASSGSRVFSQTNDAVANALRDLIRQFMPANQELLIDAYCGRGFFAKALLDKCKHAIGIDWDKFAIEAARENATTKETYIAGDIDLELERLRSIAPTFQREKAVLIVDPPATGLTPAVRKSIVALVPETVIYVSCNPPTLARDLADLRQRFTVESVTPLDMFPQTAEIEVAVSLQAK